MIMEQNKKNISIKSKELRKNLTEAEFERYVRPYLPFKISGRPDKIALWRVYNYIAKVLRTGMQWSELTDFIEKDSLGVPEITYTCVWRRYNHWSAFGVFERSFEAMLADAAEQSSLDLSVLNGDGTNTIAKKGATLATTQVINIRKGVSE